MSDSESPAIPEEIPVPPAPQPAPRLLAFLARRPLAVLALLGLLAWLPGVLSLPPLDRDESRFAESSRQMVETGNLVDIRFGHVPRYKKPVGIYWLQAASTAVFGMGDDRRIWTYRLPSLAGAILAARLTVWTAAAFLDAEAALVAALLLLSTVLLAAEATIATTDAVLLAAVVAVQGVLLRVYRAARDGDAPRPSKGLVWWGWAAVGIGALVKFPIVPGVALVTVVALVAWDRQWRWLAGLKPLRGLLLALLLASPWLIAISIQSHGAFLQQSVGNDFAAKLAGGQESHGAPPGYYLLLMAATLFPAVLFVAPGVALGVARFREPAVRFLLVWAVLWWVAVEAVPTKLPHYVLPAYPALAILAALFVTQAAPAVKYMALALTVTRWLAGLQYLAGAVLLVAAIVVAPAMFGDGNIYWLWGAAAAGACLALAALVMGLFSRSWSWSVILSLLAMLVLAPALTAGAGPRLSRLWISQRLKPLVDANAQPGDPPPSIAGYQEPSLVFALGADVNLTDGAGAAQAGAKSGGLALVEDAQRGAFLARLAELQADGQVLGEVSGLNYSRGRPVHVLLYRIAAVH
jgi:4-amino-4-deoxy-L-arabinose transferase-like glycosyltransferase